MRRLDALQAFSFHLLCSEESSLKTGRASGPIRRLPDWQLDVLAELCPRDEQNLGTVVAFWHFGNGNAAHVVFQRGQFTVEALSPQGEPRKRCLCSRHIKSRRRSWMLPLASRPVQTGELHRRVILRGANPPSGSNALLYSFLSVRSQESKQHRCFRIILHFVPFLLQLCFGSECSQAESRSPSTHTSCKLFLLCVRWETTKASIMISYWALWQWKVGVSHISNPASHARPNCQSFK